MKFFSRNDGFGAAFTTDRSPATMAPDWMEVEPTVIIKAIMEATNVDRKLQLIKMFRNLSNLGLKEAKDEIETVQPYPNLLTSKDIVPMVKVFVKYLPELEPATQAFPELKTHFLSPEQAAKLAKAQAAAERAEALEQEKRKEKEIKDTAARQRKAVLDGLTCAYDNASILGYRSEYEAMREVLARLEDMP